MWLDATDPWELMYADDRARFFYYRGQRQGQNDLNLVSEMIGRSRRYTIHHKIQYCGLCLMINMYMMCKL